MGGLSVGLATYRNPFRLRHLPQGRTVGQNLFIFTKNSGAIAYFSTA
ncbi:hypothetical protein [[Limnothrix rosea] IAM M-220]|nr:hypothetical protein [[Limnothrix rosea] IAM M-220]